MKRYRKHIFSLASFLILVVGLGTTTYLITQRQDIRNRAAETPLPNNPITKKVLVLNFNPVINGVELTVLNGWNNPTDLVPVYIQNLKETSGDYLNYTIVEQQNIDDIPVKMDGFKYTKEAYMACWRDHSKCHAPDGVNYYKILEKYDVCGKRNRGEIDELWLFGGPWFGYWEAVMAGPKAFFTNAPPLSSTSCQKQLHIMGFNYERGVSEMLEDFGHRTEGTMTYLFDENPIWDPSMKTPWGRFAMSDKLSPGHAGCGWMHYAPNSDSVYDWGNNKNVTSNCEDWLNYPNLTNTTQTFNCSRWNCDGYQYKKWWLSHIPKTSGMTDGKWNNWWKYLADFEDATNVLVLSVSPNLATPSGIINLTWSGINTPTPADWVGIYSPDETDNKKYKDWVYVRNSGTCTKTTENVKAYGSCQYVLPANLPAGSYQLRLFANNGFTKLGTSNIFTITPPAGTTISIVLSKNSLLTVNFKNITSPTPADWVGIYSPNETDNKKYKEWVYVRSTEVCTKTTGDGKVSGSCQYALPTNLPAGNYELRLFANNGFTKLATSNLFIINPPVTPTLSTTSPSRGLLTVNFQDIANPTPADWIGIYSPNETDNKKYKEWVYVRSTGACTKTVGDGKSSGSCQYVLPANLPAGSYQLRLFANNGFTKLATGNIFVTIP